MVGGMISFIMIEKDTKKRELYTKVIKKFLYTSDDYYDVYEFEIYNKDTVQKLSKIEGQKIYLLSDEIPGINGFELARNIRIMGDVSSPIILFTNSKEICTPEITKNTLILNIIHKDSDVVLELWDSLHFAYRCLTKHSALTFSIFDELYRLPYDDIYYIEKNINDDTVTIFTKDDTYTLYISIKQLEKKLIDDPRFFTSHRSCILNTFNVQAYDKRDNLVIFNNGLTTKLVCRSKKKLLVNRLSINSQEECVINEPA